ncbi:hypothetical protein H6B33_12205 [Gemmiger formicilis]|uniref:hypothetical protein n=1 Tax=Gemmiger formicilis TaxID=745368 RepID=UPI00195E84CE|nr:hypothetical protein [Gemmiger formicilis]MBM6916157.1 hypothetical protein [Gemmiger formicilis]
MAFTRIKDSDLAGKGVKDQSTVPGLSAEEMKASVEQIVREVAIPGVNRLVDELGAETAAGNIGMQVPSTMPTETGATVGEVVTAHIENQENPHAVTAAQVGAYTRQETDAAIDNKVQAIGAADMSKAEFATNGRPGIVDKAVTAETADSATAADDGVKVYTHSRSGTVNELTGDGPNGRALMTADVQPGDTWTVNGQLVTAYMGTEDATDSMAGQPYNGKWVTFVAEGTTLNFKGGNGLSPDDQSKLIPKNILNGVTFFEGTPKEVIGSLKILAAGGASASGYYVFWDGEKYQNGDFGVSTPSFNFVGTPIMAVVNMLPESKAGLTICGVPVTGNSQAQVLTELSGTEIKVTNYVAEFYCGFAVLGYN